jgi:hypothetical protein
MSGGNVYLMLYVAAPLLTTFNDHSHDSLIIISTLVSTRRYYTVLLYLG